jgi:D-tyrosyl-tRNA(Tyr) deacylase
MRALIQRCSKAQVSVAGETVGQINAGILVFLGVGPDDTEEDEQWLLQKLLKLRIFNDEAGLMNRSIQDVAGQMLVVSQFTLHAQVKKGTRPSYARAAPPDQALAQYRSFLKAAEAALGQERLASGRFGEHMEVSLVNDGPVTIWIDTKNKE